MVNIVHTYSVGGLSDKSTIWKEIIQTREERATHGEGSRGSREITEFNSFIERMEVLEYTYV